MRLENGLRVLAAPLGALPAVHDPNLQDTRLHVKAFNEHVAAPARRLFQLRHGGEGSRYPAAGVEVVDGSAASLLPLSSE